MGKTLGWICSVGFVGLMLSSGCTPLPASNVHTVSATPRAPAEAAADDSAVTGIATYLSDEFHGQTTASGVPYDKDALVAAHKSLPFESQVRVTNLATGQHVVVVVVDRMPEIVESVIDVSSAAAAELGMLESGETEVSLELLGN
jgi:rare lipoprotein A